MNMQRLIFVVSIFFFVSKSHLAAMPSIQESLATLAEWAELCFELLPEYKKPVSCFNNMARFSNKSGITAEVINDLYAQYIKIHPPQTASFVQKLHISLDSSICFMGDLHGSIHALLRNLLRLYAKNFIGNNWQLAQDSYLIFLGDFVDRGSYGTECWCTLMKLAIANPHNVILIQGNHEQIKYQITNEFSMDHFNNELFNKISLDDDAIYQHIFTSFLGFCSTLPLAVFLSPKKNSSTFDYVQCSHGGIEPHFDTLNFLQSSEKIRFLSATHDHHDNGEGFMWSDFTGEDFSGFIKPDEWMPGTRGAGYLADIADTKKYLHQSSLKAFFRGHQDADHSFKLVVIDKPDVVALPLLNQIRTEDAIDETTIQSTGIPMSKFLNKEDTVPVFTFTTATEARSLYDEGFGIVTMAENFNDWKIKPHIYTKGTGFILQVDEFLAFSTARILMPNDLFLCQNTVIA